MNRLVWSAVLVIVGATLMPAAVTATPMTDGHAGVWRAIDCAQWESDGPLDVQCDIWGDGSSLKLIIGRGDSPRIHLIDSYSMYCDLELQAPTAHRVARGYGSYDEDGMLWIEMETERCGSAVIGPNSDGAFYWDPGSDTLWSDDPDGDGYGLHWWRVGG